MLTPYGEWVRAFRERERITLREMARALGKSPSFLSAMELGRKSVPLNIIEAISAEYALSQEERLQLERAADVSRAEAKVRFEERTGSNEREVAMLFARNFEGLTEEQTQRIRQILEEEDGRPKR